MVPVDKRETLYESNCVYNLKNFFVALAGRYAFLGANRDKYKGIVFEDLTIHVIKLETSWREKLEAGEIESLPDSSLGYYPEEGVGTTCNNCAPIYLGDKIYKVSEITKILFKIQESLQRDPNLDFVSVKVNVWVKNSDSDDDTDIFDLLDDLTGCY
jgi:hypothetical protein